MSNSFIRKWLSKFGNSALQGKTQKQTSQKFDVYLCTARYYETDWTATLASS